MISNFDFQQKYSPLANAELVLSDALHLHVKMTEVLLEGSAGSVNVDDTVLDRERHLIGERDHIEGLYLPHGTLKK